MGIYKRKDREKRKRAHKKKEKEKEKKLEERIWFVEQVYARKHNTSTDLTFLPTLPPSKPKYLPICVYVYA